jgi:ComF family protein
MKIKMNYLKKFTTWLLPYTCILCGFHSNRMQDLCECCLNELSKLTDACPRCAKPLSLTNCSYCAVNSPMFDRTYALYLYQAPVTNLIMNLKFGQALLNARILGELMAENIQRIWYHNQPLPQAIIPVPLHPERLKKRGYNQAIEIARPIAKALDLPLEYNICERIKHTAAQATLHAKERSENIKNAFQIKGELLYDYVAVIDDVITTGNTISEICRTLKSAGVKKIDAWCCARPDMGVK